jgi:hypothetical protein
MNAVHIFPNYFFKTPFHITPLFILVSFECALSFNFSYQNFLWILFFLHVCYMPRLSHPPRFFIPILFGEKYNYKSPRCSSMSSLLYSYFLLLGQNVLLSIRFSTTLCLCSSFDIRDRVSQTYRATGKNCSVVYCHV